MCLIYSVLAYFIVKILLEFVLHVFESVANLMLLLMSDAH